MDFQVAILFGAVMLVLTQGEQPTPLRKKQAYPRPYYPPTPTFPQRPPVYPPAYPPQPLYPPKPLYPHQPVYPQPQVYPPLPYPRQPVYPQPPVYPHQPVYPPAPLFPPAPVFPPPPVYPPGLYPPNPQLPSGPCDGCDKGNSGFEDQEFNLNQLWRKLEDLKANIDGCGAGAVPSGITVVFASEGGIGSQSEAACPIGHIVISCRCNNEGTACKGTTISPNEDVCTARPIPTATIMAIAICSPNTNNEFDIQSKSTTEVSAVCPGAQIPVDCWRFDLPYPNFIDYASRSCNCPSTLAPADCKIWALCKKTVIVT